MIEIKNASFRYKSADILNLQNVNLSIPDGECVLLSGRSGCGKTTLLRLLNGLIPHFYEGEIDGSVTVDGMDVMETPMYRLAAVSGTVYQNPRAQFFNVDTTGEILFGIENLAYPRDELFRRFEKAVQTTGVENLLNRKIGVLSGGEKQKIAFASVYAMEPDIYLLDEPSANLDAAATERLKEQLAALKAAGKTIVITEHRLAYLRNIVDRVLYLQDGEIRYDMPAVEFYHLSEDKRISLGLRMLREEVFFQNEMDTKENGQAFELKGVSTGYKGKPVIHDMTFTAYTGEIVAITGHNGAGKSTLAQTMCGLLKPSSGEIFYGGRRLSTKELQNICFMVFQDVDYQLFADSVENECTYGTKSKDANGVSAVLEEMQLMPWKDKHPATLSGGQKQRLAVATGMMCKKSVYVFDEPTSGLDYDSMLRVSGLLRRLSEKAVVFVITHDTEFIGSTCTRVMKLANGRLRENENRKRSDAK